MPQPVDHVLLTRFNLPSAGHESLVRARENWLRDRVALFDRYCLPSVRAQSCPDFSWLIYFDPESPGWLRDWVRSHEGRGSFSPVFRESVSREQLLADIRAVLGRPHRDQLLTTTASRGTSSPGCRRLPWTQSGRRST
jgi:putative rhamnosyltransferase